MTKAMAEDFSSTDALSLTSDYSTTSSAPLTVPVTVSCIDHLVAASSDYASSDVSPCTRNASASPRHPDLEAADVSWPLLYWAPGLTAFFFGKFSRFLGILSSTTQETLM